MGSVKRARSILLTIIVLFALVDVAAIVVLLLPTSRPSAERMAVLEQLKAERQRKEIENRPTHDIDKKLADARQQIAAFYTERLPDNYSDIANELGRAASAHHVQLSAVKYDAKPSTAGDLTTVAIRVTLDGDYSSEMQFINELERSKKLFILDRVALGDVPSTNQVHVELQLETYMRAS